MLRFPISCLLLCVCVSMAAAANWPRFRGENGRGIAVDEGVPVELDAKKPLWQVDLPGQGNSSPIVWQGRIFLQTTNDDGSQRKVVCLSLKDGQTLWTADIPGEPTGFNSGRNSLASGTLCTDGQRVYVPAWDGKSLSIIAYDFEGKEIWTQPLGTFAGQHGAGHSPIVVGDKVVFLFDQDGKSSLVALDAASGKPVWESPRQARQSCYSTPILIDHPGVGQVILAVSTTAFTAHHPDTGSEIWKWNWTDNPLRTVGSPIVGEGLVIVGSGNGKGARHAVAIRMGGSGDVTPTALAWEEKRTFPYVPCMLVHGENLYFVNDSGLANCVSLKTGKDVWDAPVRLGGNFSASPLLVNGKVYAVNEQGEVFVFEAAPTYKLLHRTKIDDSVYASPAVADGRLLIRGRAKLFCFGK